MTKIQLRKSMQDFNPVYVEKRAYHSDIPDELKPLHYYLNGDAGHVIMSVIGKYIDEARASGYDGYEAALPVKYVLEKGYAMENGYCVVDVEYSENAGAVVGSEYYEY